MNVLVTGGSGIIGNAAIPALLRAGHKVRLLSRHAEEDVRSLPERVEPFVADIAVPETLNGAMDACECVLHVAGIAEENPPESTFEGINVAGTRHLVAAARKSGQPYFIYVSSLGADRGNSDYQKSKIRAEELLRSYHGPWLVLRPGNVYGPGDDTISMLLKMVRSLPAVPMVSGGEQPFQPLWHADFAEVIQQVVERRELNGETLELAGPDVTTTDDILHRLGEITGRKVPRLSVPVWVTEVGVQMLEAFGSAGKKLLRRAGLDAPITSAKLDMLLEENVISPGGRNALLDFVAEPTSLQDGLEMLADYLPEQLPGDGVGTVEESTFSAEIEGSPHRAKELLDLVCGRITEVMPIDFAAEPGSPERAEVGTTMTAALFARGNIQVKLEERTETRATFVTLEGHPLAGVMQLHAEDLPDAVRFSIHIASQPSNVVDWVGMRLAGGPMQRANWRGVVRRVVALSGGKARGPVRHETHPMDAAETADIRRFAERVVTGQLREERSLRSTQT